MRVRMLYFSVSLATAIVLAIVGNALVLGGGMLLASFIRNASDSIIANFIYTLLWGLALLAVAGLEASIVVPLVFRTRIEKEVAEENRVERLPSLGDVLIKDLNFPFAAGAILFILVTLFAANAITRGFFLTDYRASAVVTLLRSDNPAERAEALREAVVIRSESLDQALRHLAGSPGPLRQGALWTIGMRLDTQAIPILRKALSDGSAEEQDNAALALARVKDADSAEALAERVRDRRAASQHLIMALAMIAPPPPPARSKTPEDRAESTRIRLAERPEGEALLAAAMDDERPLEHRASAIWGLGRIEYGRALLPLLGIAAAGHPIAIRCAAVGALGKIGHADSSQALVDLLRGTPEDERCPEMTFSDLGGQKTGLLGVAEPFQHKLLHAIAEVGDRRVRAEMKRISESPEFSESVRYLSREIAGQMNY